MSFELVHLKRTKVRLSAWLMHHDTKEIEVHAMVSEAWQKVSKVCQILEENEEYERQGRKDE